MGVGPAGVHAVEHLGPVLGLGAAGAGVEGQNGVVGVVLAVEHGHQLQLVHRLLHRVDGFLAFRDQAGVVFLGQHLQHGAGVLVLGVQLLKAVQLALQVAHLGVDLLALFLVVVKAGQRHLVLQLGQALLAGLDGQCVAQVVDGGLKAAQFGFQFVQRDHMIFNTPFSMLGLSHKSSRGRDNAEPRRILTR